MELDRKAFHFDLDNESVKRFYTGKRNAWSDIQDFLESHSFEKPQYSGYESAENIVMSYQRAYGTIDEMMYKFPWFQKIEPPYTEPYVRWCERSEFLI